MNNIGTVDFGFTPVEIEIHASCHKKIKTVWLVRAKAKAQNPNAYDKTCFSKDIIDAMHWKANDRLELMKSADSKTLAFRKVTHSASFILKQYGTCYCIQARNLTMNMRTHARVYHHADVTEWDAQPFGEYLIITPKGVEAE